jgi:hypothetical protein
MVIVLAHWGEHLFQAYQIYVMQPLLDDARVRLYRFRQRWRLHRVITANNGPARLLRNDNANQNDVLRVKLIGTKSNRNAIGVKVTLITGAGATLTRMVKGGSSYLSQSELPLTFGLGKPGIAKNLRLQIVWPSGLKDAIPDVKPNQFLTIQEGKRILSSVPINFAGVAARATSSPQR